MLPSLKVKIGAILKKDSQRSEMVAKNIFLSFGVKGGGIIVSLVLVPMTINYISPVQYGLWLTISSLLGWMNFFDIGFGNGLRNKLASSVSNNNFDEAKKYVSTTYASLCVISAFLFLCFWLVNPFLNWNKWLNVPGTVPDDIHFIMLIVLSSFCFLFVAQLINTVLTAIHKPAISSLLTFLGQFVILIVIYILKNTTPGTLTLLVSVLTAIPIFVFVLSSLYLYSKNLKYLAPSIRKIEWKYVRDLMNTGGMFFVIQIGVMFLFQTNNIIITNILGPEAVTEFNVSYKLFSVVTMIFTIIITPYWSAFTDSYVKKDFEWMKNTVRNIRKIWLMLAILSIILLLLSKEILHMWVGEKVQYSSGLSVAMAVYVIVYMWQVLHVYFLNGVGKIKLQLILTVLASAINIPLVVWLGKTWGLPGVISANSIVIGTISFVFSLQVKYILNDTAKGLWGA
jgi:O-antigen/teichoic acid export membrane protein